MKAVYCFVLIIAFCASISGCGTVSTQTDADGKTTQEWTPQPEITMAVEGVKKVSPLIPSPVGPILGLLGTVAAVALEILRRQKTRALNNEKSVTATIIESIERLDKPDVKQAVRDMSFQKGTVELVQQRVDEVTK